jgi:hypothetical protein
MTTLARIPSAYKLTAAVAGLIGLGWYLRADSANYASASRMSRAEEQIQALRESSAGRDADIAAIKRDVGRLVDHLLANPSPRAP